MKNDECVISDKQGYTVMWTAQAKRVIDTLEHEGVYYVKKRYLDEKYQETAWIFKTAYDFFISQAQKRIPKPDEAESPVWMFRDRKWAVPDQNTRLLKLQIPSEQLILFDLRRWSRILNLSYIGDEAQQQEFDREMERQGIGTSSDVFAKPYYPILKNKIVKSWGMLFETEGLTDEYTQGATWLLRREWIAEMIT